MFVLHDTSAEGIFNRSKAMSSRIFTKIDYFSQSTFWDLLSRWPKEHPLLALGGNGSSNCLIGTRFREVCREEFLSQRVNLAQKDQSLLPFSTGYVACLPYEEKLQDSGSNEESKFFYVSEALIFKGGEVFFVSENTAKNEEDVSYPLAQLSTWLDNGTLDTPFQKAAWKAKWSRDEYLEKVGSCKEDIFNGRYYQINLLQYYELDQEEIQWFSLFKTFSGPFAAWIRFGDLELISFSPCS